MKKIKSAIALLVCLCVTASLASCAPAPGGSDVPASENVPEVNTATPQTTTPDVTPPPGTGVASGLLADGANGFAFRLSAALVKNAGDENFVCSPYSVWLPLAALVSATDEQSKPALLSALGAADISETHINEATQQMLYDLTNLRGKEYEGYYNPLKIVNAIFVDDNVTLKQAFAQNFAGNFSGNAMNVDFSSADAVDAVNRWASENTDGLITDIVEEFDPQTVAAIANAIYFSDVWSWEFNAAETTEDVFHAPAGDTTAFYMLREGKQQLYYEDDKLQAMPLEFLNGGGMYILLPKDGGASELLASMTGEYFNEIRAGAQQADGKLLLPRFSIENDIKGLKDVLIALGVPLFDEEAAPLTGLIEEDEDLWLSDAIHKAVIEVDEKGTTAAAVTIMPVPRSAPYEPPPTAPFEMICDKPFAFILYETASGGEYPILFTGVVNQP
ncbi:MAG: hypothetical protein LBK23_07200 [Oscillospiraceae bacterium]|jgi:serpin B|nr:hypothetical protein [Oscillospiraceae bacterium]